MEDGNMENEIMEDEIMEDKMTKKFLTDMISLARGQLKTVEERILERCQGENDDMEEAFLFCLEALAGEYRQLRACNAAGPAKSMYISYLRTSVLLGFPMYRIDLYDERERSSLAECGCRWDFAYTASYFEKIRDNLAEKFARQTRVKGYCLDRILYQIGDEFYSFTCGLIAPMIVRVFPRIRQIKGLGQLEKCCLGEFMDRANVVFSKKE